MSKKVSMQDLADAMNISRITVWKALNNQSGISETMKSAVFEKAEELGYLLKNKNNTYCNVKVSEKNISVIVSRPESSVFWTNIIHHIAKSLSELNINLVYTYVPPTADDSYQLPKNLINSSVDGLIILNIYDFKLIKLIDKINLPKVYLDTVPMLDDYSLNGDLVLLEGIKSTYEITSDIINSGIRKLGFIGDIHYAKTNQDRFQGFVNALNDSGININDNFIFNGPMNFENYYDDISNFIDHLSDFPEAFICSSDDISHFLIQLLEIKGISIPNDILVSGFDGCSNLGGNLNFLTTVNVNLPMLSKRLVNQILFRIENKEADFETIYISSKVVWGNSTLRKD